MQLEDVIKELKKMKAKRVFVQFPEGLKLRIQNMSKQLEKEGFEIVLCLEATWGACDVREHEAKLLKCDAILHIAHEDFGVKTTMPVVYWDYLIDADPTPILEKEFNKLEPYQKIGLVTSIQYIKTLPVVKKFLEKRGKEVFIGKGDKIPGQMLGCRVGAGILIEDKVDAFLCITAGQFYGLGLALKSNKPLLNLDLEQNSIYRLDTLKKKVEKITAWNIAQVKEARRIGILVSWKLGQFTLPFEIKKKLEKIGKEVFIIAMDEFTTAKLEGLKLDALVNTACPRIGTDDLEKYKLPIVNVEHLYKGKIIS